MSHITTIYECLKAKTTQYTHWNNNISAANRFPVLRPIQTRAEN